MPQRTLDRLYRGFLRSLALRLNHYSSVINSSLFERKLRELGVDNASEIPSWTKRSELKALYQLASACPRGALALEIGSYQGASSAILAAGLAQVNGHLLCVDTWDNLAMPDGIQDTLAAFQKNTHGVRQTITALRKKSSDLTCEELCAPLSLVFIDGDHRYSAVKSDFELVKQWTAGDGIIAFHDFGHEYFEGVSRVVGEALAGGEWRVLGLVDTLVWIQRVKWTPPDWLRDA